MGVFMCIILMVILVIAIWFLQPYSPLQAYFMKLDKRIMAKNGTPTGTFRREELAYLPMPIQRFFEFSGLINKPKMHSSITIHNNVDFILTEGKPPIKIRYIQHNYGYTPERMAFIDTKMYGIPFQGLDTYVDGVGCMKGILAKGITLFEQKSKEMDEAALVTLLAESIVCPSAFLMDCITWETISDTQVRATIHANGLTVGGIYTLSKEGAILSFTTNDRYEVDPNGKATRTPWTAECGVYKEIDGIKYPTSFKGIWNRKEGDYIYFDCNQVDVAYRY